MSYDRVLPKPAILHHDSSRQDHRSRSNTLLEHKIMTDKFSKVAEERDGSRRPNSLLMDKALPSAPLPQPLAIRSSVNCEEPMTEGSKVPLTRKRVATIATNVTDRDNGQKSPPLGSPKSASSKDSVVQFCLCQPDPKIPRPRNGKQHYQASVVAQNPGLANPEISKIIGEQWRALPNETKKEWKALAEEEKARHQQQYPDYRYQPRRYGRNSSVSGNAAAVAANNNPTGASVCSRCGGRVMNPPSTPSTPFTPVPISATASPRLSHALPRSFQARATREGARIPSPVQIPGEQKGHPRQRLREEPSCLSPDPKRRRFSPNGSYTPIARETSPESQYPFSPRRASIPRPDVIHPRSAYPMGPPPRPYRGGPTHQSHDLNLTLPPLQTVSLSPPGTSDKSIEAMVMAIPFINKIKVLSKISPSYIPSSATGSGAPEVRGAVVAVEGQDKRSVNCMLQYLKEHLQSKDGEYNIRVFEGPDPDLRSTGAEDTVSNATVKYLDTISSWHKVSDEIVHFITSEPSAPSTSVSEEPTSGISPKSIIPKTAKLRISELRNSPIDITARRGTASAATPTSTPITATTPKPTSTPTTTTTTTTFPLPVALISRYQLSTSDAHACANPVNDAYSPIEHWQWMASLWRGCVGPDITIYLRGCEKEELNKYGGGTPVDIRLNDARSLVVRKSNDAESEIEEKALRRVGFEVEEFLRK